MPVAAAVGATAVTEPPAVTDDEEPAGWAAAPEAVDTNAVIIDDEAEEDGVIDFEPVGSVHSATATETAGASAAGASAAGASAARSTTPAGWYPDPSTRFEMRYWDGGQWTEHVARGGQQSTDPPVA
jgi:hypothetical protein